MRVISQLFKIQCFVILALAFAGLQAQAQHSVKEIKPDPRLYECFPKDYVDGLKSNPRLLLYYNFYLDHAYFMNVPQGKPSQGIDISTVTYRDPGPDGKVRYFDEDLSTFDPAKFCALKYSFKPSQEGYTHYLLGKTGKVLIFYPAKDFVKSYNDYLKSFGLDKAK